MTATLADHLRDAAVACDHAGMPADPFTASDLIDACRVLGVAVVALSARIRAHRVANAVAWAEWEASAAELDKGTKPPPPPPDPEPEPQPEPQPVTPPTDGDQ